MRNHYVPEFLLSAWADTTYDRELEVFRLDLPGLPSKRHTPKHTGFEHDLYALTRPVVAGMEKHAIETQLLRRIDNDAATVLQKFYRSGFKEITQTDQVSWARFLMSLRVRQPAIVARLRTEAPQQLLEVPEPPAHAHELGHRQADSSAHEAYDQHWT